MNLNRVDNGITGSPPLLAILYGLFLALFLSALLLFIASAVLHLTTVPEYISPYIIFGVSLIGIVFGSRLAGKKAGSRGWLNGGMVGLLYVVILLLVGLLFIENFALSLLVLSKLFIGFIFGAFGGMLGVNA